MTEIQNGIWIVGLVLIVWNVIGINSKLSHIRLAKNIEMINQEKIVKQLESVKYQVGELREANEKIPKILRQIRHYVSGGTVEELKEMEDWYSGHT